MTTHTTSPLPQATEMTTMKLRWEILDDSGLTWFADRDRLGFYVERLAQSAWHWEILLTDTIDDPNAVAVAAGVSDSRTNAMLYAEKYADAMPAVRSQNCVCCGRNFPSAGAHNVVCSICRSLAPEFA